MTWAEKFPHPGPRPPEPGGTPDLLTTEWNQRRRAFNAWIKAVRRYTVGLAVDELVAAEGWSSPANAVALVIGMEYLENGGELGGMGLFAPNLEALAR
jgi:hypothetical protein